jgi:hypothetical protein
MAGAADGSARPSVSAAPLGPIRRRLPEPLLPVRGASGPREPGEPRQPGEVEPTAREDRQGRRVSTPLSTTYRRVEDAEDTSGRAVDDLLAEARERTHLLRQQVVMTVDFLAPAQAALDPTPQESSNVSETRRTAFRVLSLRLESAP